MVFLVSGWFAGIAGTIYALLQNLVSTDGVLTAFMSFYPIMMAFVGGIGSFFGPIYGSAILMIMDELITAYTERVELVTGMVFIVVVLYAPMGFAGLLSYVRIRFFKKENR